METLSAFKDGERCVFCKENVVDEFLFGKIFKYEDVITHYFCLLFSSEVEQNGKDNEGILGFLPIDIKKEIKRGGRIACSYCHHNGATINCNLKSCKKKFHYPCGIENGSMHQFFDVFKSFCVSHRKIQQVPPSACKLTDKNVCLMCYEEVKPKPSLSTIWAPCCGTTWFHRTCVQKMAISAGYFFKCPACNNKDDFRKEMWDCGIYIPDQDASWELEPHAFDDLGQRYNHCDAESCSCPEGRSCARSDGPWVMMLCMYCGSQGIHFKCAKKKKINDLGKWICSICSGVTDKSLSLSFNIAEEEEAGPSVLLHEETRPSSNHRNRRPGQRKRVEKSQLEKSDSTFTDTRDPVKGIQSNWPLANVVNINEESDENESDVECDVRSTTRLQNPPIILRPNNMLCSSVIDLDSDSDDKLSQSDHCVSSTCDLENNDDDVIFVSSDVVKKDFSDDLPATSALLRFVDNNTVYIVSPADVKRRGGIENLTSTLNPSCPSTENKSTPESTNTAVWQPVPLHKSVVHSLAASEINQDFNPVINNYAPLDEFIEKTNSNGPDKKRWKPDPSEIIYID